MGYIKCPRCELNYIPDTERYCSVCKREMRGEDEHEELELCSACLKELKLQEGVVTDVGEEETVPEESDVTALEATSELEEIDIDVDEDIPSNEYSEIHKELGMDDDLEDEEEAEDDKPEDVRRK